MSHDFCDDDVAEAFRKVKAVSRYNIQKIRYWKRVFGLIFCPKCDIKMEIINSPFEPGWKCHLCGWITWQDIQ